MVFVSLPEEILLDDVRKMLLRELKPLSKKQNLEEAFAAWLLGEEEIPFCLDEMANIASARVGGQRSYHDIAILGFATISNLQQATNRTALKEGLDWLMGRDPIPDGQLQGFCTDVVALLGIAFGVKALESEAIATRLSTWLSEFIEQSFQSRLDDWQRCFLVAVCQLGGVSLQKPVPDSEMLADVRTALRSKGVLSCDVPSMEKDQRDVLSIMKLDVGNQISSYRAALRLAAFKSIQQIVPTIDLQKPSTEDVLRILDRVPAAFRRWTWEDKARTKGKEVRKWHIDNEYHVQNFLYSLLSPIFPDLEDESYTSNVGQMHPRADLLIPSLNLIIEVKFMREGDKPQKMIEQIAADTSLYLTDCSLYRYIIAFIWDDSCQSHEHDYMKNGIRQLSGIVGSVVMSRPGKMVVQTISS
jgi:hypothetical protein